VRTSNLAKPTDALGCTKSIKLPGTQWRNNAPCTVCQRKENTKKNKINDTEDSLSGSNS
jgi:hypothetical protein